jgi:hypothetical protein
MSAKEDGVNLLDYIDDSYIAKQLEAILYSIKLLKNEKAIKKILNNNMTGSVIKTIANGINEGYDVSSYFIKGDNYTSTTAKIELLKNGKDPSELNKFKNIKINYNLLKDAILKDINLDFVNEDVDPNKLIQIIKYALNNDDPNIEYMKKPEITVSQIKSYIEYKDVRLIAEHFDDTQIKVLNSALRKNQKIDSICNSILPAEVMSSILKCESFGYKVNLTREDDIEK